MQAISHVPFSAGARIQLDLLLRGVEPTTQHVVHGKDEVQSFAGAAYS